MRKKKHKKNLDSPSRSSDSTESSPPPPPSDPPAVAELSSEMEVPPVVSPEPTSPSASIEAQDTPGPVSDTISDLVETTVSQIQTGTNTSELEEKSSDPGLSNKSSSTGASPQLEVTAQTSVKVTPVAAQMEASSQMSAKATRVANPDPLPNSSTPTTNSWSDLFKGSEKRLSKKGKPFNLASGQFYSDPPSQGTIHNIVNGIWSKYYRDITLSKMEGFLFLFRIPNAATRSRVLEQRLWQIEGQTMFVGKWEPGVIPVKPELTSAPIWLELREVPFRCFNDEALERIASAVGEPKCLHPSTANKTNLEVAKVFTLIDPRKPLPEAVNVKFNS
ncbi:unnamed protein product [Microthlaspi erraticum]|uniref:DUF4283 domain-containing protein n=1 Tax=Microthlaspi erraticum TaxID=1685480 RepID=A0A6D2LEB2_9BRAS|nr:unnamed protein product [Microthlaspi erraticum]